MTVDRFNRAPIDPTAPWRATVAVTPSDTVAQPAVLRGLYIGVAGDVKVDTPGYEGQDAGVGIVFKAVPIGFLPVFVTKVWATGTTATNIVGGY